MNVKLNNNVYCDGILYKKGRIYEVTGDTKFLEKEGIIVKEKADITNKELKNMYNKNVKKVNDKQIKGKETK